MVKKVTDFVSMLFLIQNQIENVIDLLVDRYFFNIWGFNDMD